MAKYKSGESGSPRGRPKGTSAIEQFRAAVGNEMPAIWAAMAEAARAGDTAAASLPARQPLLSRPKTYAAADQPIPAR